MKVQVPLSTNDPMPMALVYNDDKTVLQHIKIDAALIKRMNGSYKQFFMATGAGASLVLGKKAPWQEW